MRKVKKFSALILTLALFISVSACADTSPANGTPPSGNPPSAGSDSENAPIVIRIGGTCAETHPVTVGQYKFEELFEAATNGAYDVQVYPNMVLGSPNEMLEAVQLGNLEITDSGNMAVAAFSNALMFMDIPYLFTSRDICFEFIDGEVARKAYDRFAEEANIRPYIGLDLGYATISNNIRPLRVPSDLNGVKFRVMENNMYLNYFEGVGGQPMPMAFNELFTALQQGTIDGTLTQNAVFYSNKYTEVTKYLSDMNPFYCIDYQYVCESWLNSLPEDVQDIFAQCWKEAAQFQRDYFLEYAEPMEADLETLVEYTHLTDEEYQQWVDSAAGMVDVFRNSVDEPNLDLYLDEIARIEEKLG